MSLALYGHPFSSYTQKVLIALWADHIAFDYRIVDAAHPAHFADLCRHSPFGQFPLLLHDGRPIFDSSCIIEHLAANHRGATRWIPDGETGRRVRFLDRFFDLYVMGHMQVAVFDAIRPPDRRDPAGVEQARGRLAIAYDWLEANLDPGPWAVGADFTLADCAAAPSLFYADWVERIGGERPRLEAYRARLLAHPAVARAVEEARPYRELFPLGAPDRD